MTKQNLWKSNLFYPIFGWLFLFFSGFGTHFLFFKLRLAPPPYELQVLLVEIEVTVAIQSQSEVYVDDTEIPVAANALGPRGARGL